MAMSPPKDLPGAAELTLENESLRIQVAPHLGGKLTDLVSPGSGRSWLWRNPHLVQRQPHPGASFVCDFDTGGWDEIFPTVASCDHPLGGWSGALTDHGELWCRPWHVVDLRNGDGESNLELILDEEDLPFRFERSFRLPAGSGALELTYQVKNRSGTALPYLWCAHPLFQLEAGMRLRLPTGSQLAAAHVTGEGGPALQTPFSWPMAVGIDGEPLDLSWPADGKVGWAAKIFSDVLAEGWVELEAPDQSESLAITFDPKVLPHLGLWLNRRGWSGTGGEPYENLGIEPGTSQWDSLSEACFHDAHRVLEPGETHSWQLRLALRCTDSCNRPYPVPMT